VKETLPPDNKACSTSLSKKGHISIAVLGRSDAEICSDHIGVLKTLIARNDDQYPGIDRWFATRVVPGLRSGERKAYVAYENDKPIAAAILKLGRSAKFCHLRVDDEHRRADLGQILWIQMTMDVMDYAQEIHFTLPESLWDTKRDFFGSFGFSEARRTLLHYRKNDGELSCSTSVSTVYSAIVKKIPLLLKRFCLRKYSSGTDIVMSMKPSFARKVIAGSKSIEIRRRFSRKWVGHEAILYATKPLGSLVGRATINSVTDDQPDRVWSQFGSSIGCSRAEFDAYVGSSDRVSAIEFKNVVQYGEAIPLSQISDLIHQKLTPPQSYFEVTFEKMSAWMNAIYFAGLLHHRVMNSRNDNTPEV
jgi:predicted transcriptional regulator